MSECSTDKEKKMDFRKTTYKLLLFVIGVRALRPDELYHTANEVNPIRGKFEPGADFCSL